MLGLALGMALAGGAGQAAGAAVGNMAAGNSTRLLDDAIFNMKSATKFQASIYRQAGLAAMQGAQYQADVYRQSGQIAQLFSNYDAAINTVKSKFTEDAIGRQMTDMLGKNYTLAAASGISIASKSVMAIQNDVLSAAETQFAQNRAQTAQQNSVTIFQGNLENMQYENKARATIYSGQLQQMEAENQARAVEYQGAVDVYQTMIENPESYMGSGSSIGGNAIAGAIGGGIAAL